MREMVLVRSVPVDRIPSQTNDRSLGCSGRQKQAQQLLQHYNTGPALLQFQHTIQKARDARKEDEENGQPGRLRADAWR